MKMKSSLADYKQPQESKRCISYKMISAGMTVSRIPANPPSQQERNPVNRMAPIDTLLFGPMVAAASGGGRTLFSWHPAQIPS
jgi:hypothetical protein